MESARAESNLKKPESQVPLASIGAIASSDEGLCPKLCPVCAATVLTTYYDVFRRSKSKAASHEIGNKKLAIVNLSTGKVAQTLAIGHDCDPTAFDSNTNLVFRSNGDGTLTVIGRGGSGPYGLRQTLKTQPGSKTMCLDAAAQKLYPPAAKFNGPPTHRPRPKVLSGTFEVWLISK